MSSLTICHRRDTNDLLQGQRSLFSESKLLTPASGGIRSRILCPFRFTGQHGRRRRGRKKRKKEKNEISQRLFGQAGTVAGGCRLLTGQLRGPRSATRSISQPPPPPRQWAAKITAQHPPQTTKLHLKRHLLLLFTLAPLLAAHSVCLKDTQKRRADWEMMNYLGVMSNCFKADILFLEGKGLGGEGGVHAWKGRWWWGGVICEEVCLQCNAGA